MPSKFSRYIEPFCGSLSLWLSLPPTRAIVGDINPELIHFYKMVRWRPRMVARLASAWGLEEDTYYKVRSLNPLDMATEDRAARFLYLNRLCFNGVYRTNRQGNFNVPRGSRVPGMPSESELAALADRLKMADIHCDDFEEIVSMGGRGDFIYLDPPYAGRGARDRGEYGKGSFLENDIDRLDSALRRASRRGAKILMSYADTETVRAALSDWNIFALQVPRNVSGFVKGRKPAAEILVRNY
ncbi:DNA adenine methylase [Xanthomonas arboricola]|uniref:DNA adenine methylase n=1 Tax=Xanthomonas arboricola TaxID=56448 RepID=UPI001FD35795|nr:Dam family site-specific DNA-(adenine-N6)-methyltransferase [Xanthomonas arboricola]